MNVRSLALLPIINLWILMLWNARVESALEKGDIYLMDPAMRMKLVNYLGYGPVIVVGILILLKIVSSSRQEAVAAAQNQYNEDDRKPPPA